MAVNNANGEEYVNDSTGETPVLSTQKRQNYQNWPKKGFGANQQFNATTPEIEDEEVENSTPIASSTDQQVAKAPSKLQQGSSNKLKSNLRNVGISIAVVTLGLAAIATGFVVSFFAAGVFFPLMIAGIGLTLAGVAAAFVNLFKANKESKKIAEHIKNLKLEKKNLEEENKQLIKIIKLKNQLVPSKNTSGNVASQNVPVTPKQTEPFLQPAPTAAIPADGSQKQDVRDQDVPIEGGILPALDLDFGDGIPQAPDLDFGDGIPQAPDLDFGDGIPQAPDLDFGDGIPQAPDLDFGDGIPQAPVINFLDQIRKGKQLNKTKQPGDEKPGVDNVVKAPLTVQEQLKQQSIPLKAKTALQIIDSDKTRVLLLTPETLLGYIQDVKNAIGTTFLPVEGYKKFEETVKTEYKLDNDVDLQVILNQKIKEKLVFDISETCKKVTVAVGETKVKVTKVNELLNEAKQLSQEETQGKTGYYVKKIMAPVDQIAQLEVLMLAELKEVEQTLGLPEASMNAIRLEQLLSAQKLVKKVDGEYLAVEKIYSEMKENIKKMKVSPAKSGIFGNSPEPHAEEENRKRRRLVISGEENNKDKQTATKERDLSAWGWISPNKK